MKYKYLISLCALAFSIGGFNHAIGLEERAPTPEEIAAQEADAAYLAALQAIAANRAETINRIMEQWDNDAADFKAELEAAADGTLYNVQHAANYNGVRAALQGRTTLATVDSGIGINALGDVHEDLTFTPVVPCRIFDTLYDLDGATKPTPGTQLNYYVHGSAALLAPQGHNQGVVAGPGCISPKGEPAGIAVNFTVRNPEGNGNIRAWPYGSARPNVSFLNYQLNTNVANAGIIATCYLCADGLDMSVETSFSASHSLADVMGYFYAAQQVVPQATYTGIGIIATPTCKNMETITITVPPGGGYVTVRGQANVHINKAADTNEFIYLYLGTSPTDCTFTVPADGYAADIYQVSGALPNTFYNQSLNVQRRFPASAGTKTYYLNITGSEDSGTPEGDWLVAHYATMQAHFSAY